MTNNLCNKMNSLCNANMFLVYLESCSVFKEIICNSRTFLLKLYKTEVAARLIMKPVFYNSPRILFNNSIQIL